MLQESSWFGWLLQIEFMWGGSSSCWNTNCFQLHSHIMKDNSIMCHKLKQKKKRKFVIFMSSNAGWFPEAYIQRKIWCSKLCSKIISNSEGAIMYTCKQDYFKIFKIPWNLRLCFILPVPGVPLIVESYCFPREMEDEHSMDWKLDGSYN